MDEVTEFGLDLVARLQATVDERVHKAIALRSQRSRYGGAPLAVRRSLST